MYKFLSLISKLFRKPEKKVVENRFSPVSDEEYEAWLGI